MVSSLAPRQLATVSSTSHMSLVVQWCTMMCIPAPRFLSCQRPLLRHPSAFTHGPAQALHRAQGGRSSLCTRPLRLAMAYDCTASATAETHSREVQDRASPSLQTLALNQFGPLGPTIRYPNASRRKVPGRRMEPRTARPQTPGPYFWGTESRPPPPPPFPERSVKGPLAHREEGGGHKSATMSVCCLSKSMHVRAWSVLGRPIACHTCNEGQRVTAQGWWCRQELQKLV